MSRERWHPAADLEVMRARAALLNELRVFFQARGVLEVETPLLARSAGTDPQLEPIRIARPDGDALYLQTSPEFAMKRLLAAGSGPIFQITRAFRDGDLGRRHNPEFTLLEWYRPGFDEHRLMDEVVDLLQSILPQLPVPERLTYRTLFRQHLGIDPHTCSVDRLRRLARERLELDFDLPDRDDWLDLLFSHLIEPALQNPCFIHDYPASQAALARLRSDPGGTLVARRFELVAGGMELANGYHELCDASEQAERFSRDLAQRREAGKPAIQRDEALLEALSHGLPDCAGVALGVDRLLMLQLGLDDIRDVLSFDFARL